jgi:uncharacterized protein (TIGR02594 family)
MIANDVVNLDKCPEWLKHADDFLGTTEFKGIKHNPVVVKFWKLIKRGGIKDDETPWCAAFVGGCLELCGILSSRFEGASSYLKWGYGLKHACVGCVAVIKRPGGWHVFFVVGKDKNGMIVGIGGNQSDSVTYATFDPNRVMAYRWPYGVEIGVPSLPTVTASGLKASKNEA